MNIPKESLFADSMAFIGLQGHLPKFGALESLPKEDWPPRPRLALAHLTSVPPFIKDVSGALEAHKLFAHAALSNQNVKAVRTADDLIGLSTVNMGLMFGMQHTPAGITYGDLISFHSAGIRSMSPAYDGATEYGGGFKAGGRLTGRGEKLIRWMTEIGIILDLSHAGESTAMRAIRFIQQERLKTKVMLSHSGCSSVFGHQRNAADELLKGIVDVDGYVGVMLISFYLGPKGSDPLTEFTRHLTHALSVTGKGRIGIGSDCNHVDMTMEQAEAHYANMTKMLKTGGTFGEYFPDRPPELIQHGANMFKVIEQKLSTGNTLMLDPGILGCNFLDFLRRSLP